MRALKIVTVLMAIMIVGGTALLGVLIARRVSTPSLQVPITLQEPAGTRISGVAAPGGVLALTLTGGGPDRVLMVDPKSLRVTGRLLLAH